MGVFVFSDIYFKSAASLYGGRGTGGRVRTVRSSQPAGRGVCLGSQIGTVCDNREVGKRKAEPSDEKFEF